MSSHTTSKIFVIGGTGAQGIPIIRALVADKKYSVRFLSRDAASRRAMDLLALDNVSILEGSFADEAIVREVSAVVTERLSTSTGSTPARKPRLTGRSAVTR